MPIERSTELLMYATGWMAFFTFLAVVAALFGGAIKAAIFKSMLKVDLRSKYGDLNKQKIFSETHPKGRLVPARFYQLCISNRAKVTKATQTQVFLTRVEEPGQDGELQIRWDSEIPLRWVHQDINPLMQTIGASPVYCDLFNIVQDKWLSLAPIITPYNLERYIQFRPEQEFHVVLSVQARSAEGVSPVARFEIMWNGKWHEGKEEMAENVIINRLPDA